MIWSKKMADKILETRLPELIRDQVAKDIIDGFHGNKKRDCLQLLKEMHLLHQQSGKQHLSKNKIISDRTYTSRWHLIHQLACELYQLRFRLKSVKNIKKRHCIALCKAWEKAGYSASTIAGKKTGLRTVLNWHNRAAVLDDVPLEELFEDAKTIHRPLKTKINKSMSAGLVELNQKESTEKTWLLNPCQIIDGLWSDVKKSRASSRKDAKRRYITMLELMYWFGLRPREASFFKPRNDIHLCKGASNVSYIYVSGKGSKGGRPRYVQVINEGQYAYLQMLLERRYLGLRVMPDSPLKVDSWQHSFNEYTRKNGLSRKNKLTPYSLRHEFAQISYEYLSDLDSPIKTPVTYKKVDLTAKKFVSQQLGHNRTSVVGAYIG